MAAKKAEQLAAKKRADEERKVAAAAKKAEQLAAKKKAEEERKAAVSAKAHQSANHVLTRYIVKKVSMSRQQHRVEVLKEQGRQKEKGIYDPELLACASRRHSVWSMKRTKKILHMRKCRS